MGNNNVEWTPEQKAESFKNEIKSRFSKKNEEYKKEARLQREKVIERDPTFLERHPEYDDPNSDSNIWEMYKSLIINIVDNTATIILDPKFSITIEELEIFNNTEMAWSKPFIEAMIINEKAFLVIKIFLIDYWNDERSREWRTSAAS